MTASTVPAAASAWVAGRVAEPRRPARVVASSPQAVYVDLGAECLGVLARTAVAVPIGLRTALERIPEVTGPVSVGDGVVSLGAYDVVVTRIVDPTVPRIAAPAERMLPLPRTPSAGSLGLPADALRALAEGEAAAALRLLGCGPGLTPAGDDVLAGWLVARHAVDRPAPAVAAAVARLAPARTSSLSATLLRRAIAGEAPPPCRDLLLALRTGTGVDRAYDRLLGVGHTSGPALALGIALGLEAHE